MEAENGTNDCSSSAMPSVQDYFSVAKALVISLAGVGAVFLVLSLIVFASTLRHILRHGSSKAKTFTAFIVAIYPVTAFLSYCSLIVPRSFLPCEAVSQGLLMAALYQLFCLLISYSGGHSALVKKAAPVRLDPKGPPCCCWPCCSLPTFTIDKHTINWLKCLVLQVPLVQGLVYFVFLVMWAEDQGTYETHYWYLQPVLIASILCGMWGLTMTIKALSGLLDPQFRLKAKFGTLQGVLLFSKLQPVLIKVFVWTNLMPCNPPLVPQLYANMIQSSLMTMEMALLGLVVRRIYQSQLPHVGRLRSARSSVISTVFGGGDRKLDPLAGVANPGYG